MYAKVILLSIRKDRSPADQEEISVAQKRQSTRLKIQNATEFPLSKLYEVKYYW